MTITSLRPRNGELPPGTVDVDVEQPSTTTTARRWAREYDACVNCGGTNYKHSARGYCKRGACEKAAKLNWEAQIHGN